MEMTSIKPLPSPSISDGHGCKKARVPFLERAHQAVTDFDDVHRTSLGHASTGDMSMSQIPSSSGTQHSRPPLAFTSNSPHNHSQTEARHQLFYEPPGSPPELFLGEPPTGHFPRPPLPFEPHDTGDSDSDDSNIFSGVSSPGRAARQGLRSFPPVQSTPVQMLREEPPALPSHPLAIAGLGGYHLAVTYPHEGRPRHGHIQVGGAEIMSNNPAQTQIANTIPAAPKLWADLYDQRQKTRLNRKRMSDLRSKIVILRSEKSKADNDLQRLTLSHSQSGQTLPPLESAMLVEKARKAQDECSLVEEKYERLGRELDIREKKLETSELRFFQSISTGADASQPGVPRLAELSFRQPSNFVSVHDGVGIQNIGQALAVPSSSSTNSLPSSDASLLGLSGERSADVHPLYTHLLEAIGTLDTSRQRYEDLVSKRQDILDGLRSRIELEISHRNEDWILDDLAGALNSDSKSGQFQAVFAGYLNKSDRIFLQSFGELYSTYRDEIVSQKRRVRCIHQTCIRRGALPDHDPLEDIGAIFSDEHHRDDDSIELDTSTSYAQPGGGPDTTSFPILVTDPLVATDQYPLPPKEALQRILELPEDHPRRRLRFDEYIKEYGIISSLSRTNPSNKADFVNRWILQSLRMSPMAAVQLYTVFTTILRVMNVKQWQNDVVYFWTRDDTNIPEQFFGGPVTEAPSSTSADDESTSADDY